MKLKEFLKKDVEWITPDATLQSAARRMKDRHVGFLPIVSPEKRVLGVVTDRDLAVRALADGVNANAHVEDVMTREIETCHTDDDLESVARMMRTRKVRRIVALDRQDHLAGVISLTDIAATAKDPKILGETVKQINIR